eukprot:XP_027306710.1 uncharacterized protein LOC113842669 [Anas platyrhynchos]
MPVLEDPERLHLQDVGGKTPQRRQHPHLRDWDEVSHPWEDALQDSRKLGLEGALSSRNPRGIWQPQFNLHWVHDSFFWGEGWQAMALALLAWVISARGAQIPLGMGSNLRFLSPSQQTPITEGEVDTDGKKALQFQTSLVIPCFRYYSLSSLKTATTFSMLNRKKAKGLTQPLQIFRNIRPQMGARIASLRREAAAIPQLPCPVTNSVCHTERSSLHSQVPQPPRGICTSLTRICGGGDFIHAFQPWCGERQGFATLTLDQSKAEVVQRGLKHHHQRHLLSKPTWVWGCGPRLQKSYFYYLFFFLF